MGNYLSPGVYSSEIDLSTSVPSVATGITGFVGEFEMGQVDKRLPVTDLEQYKKFIGLPTDKNYNDWYQGERFLRNGSELYVVRSVNDSDETLTNYPVIDSSHYYAIGEGALYNGYNYTALVETYGVIDVDVNGDPQNASIGVWQKEEAQDALPAYTEPKTMNAGVKFSSIGSAYYIHELIKNSDDFGLFESTYTQSGTEITFFAKSPGSLGNEILVSLSNDLSKGVEKPVSTTWIGETATDWVAGTYSIDDVVFYDSKIWKSLQDSNTAVPGATGSETYWEDVSYTINDVVYYNGNNWYSLTSNNGDEPTTSSTKWAQGTLFEDLFESKLSSDEYALVVYYQGDIKEKYIVSSSPTGVDADNNNIFIDNILNETSDFVYSITASTNIPSLVQQRNLVGGKYTSPESANIIASYSLFQNPEDFDLSVIIANEKANQFVADLAKQRADCVAIVGAKKSDVVGVSDPITNLVDYVNVQELNTDNSYAAFYGNYIQVFDEYNAKYRWINVAGSVAGSQIRTNNNRDPWWANAGLERGQLGDVIKIAFNPTQGERDILYRNKINPVVNFPGQGNAIIWGQKTLLSRASAFDRINVRQLFLVIEKAVDKAMKYFVFEPNDVFLRAQIIAMITPFLEDIKGRRGIYEYKIICDETNNTAEVIDANKLRLDVLVKPTRVAEFVEIQYVSTKTGANLSEVATAVA